MAERNTLIDLLTRQARVIVTNPDHPNGGWIGRIIALADDPSVVIEREPDRLRISLPQFFDIAELPDSPADRNDDAVILLRAATLLAAAGKGNAARDAMERADSIRRREKTGKLLREAEEARIRWGLFRDWAQHNLADDVTQLMDRFQAMSLEELAARQKAWYEGDKEEPRTLSFLDSPVAETGVLPADLAERIDRFLDNPDEGEVRTRPAPRDSGD